MLSSSLPLLTELMFCTSTLQKGLQQNSGNIREAATRFGGSKLKVRVEGEYLLRNKIKSYGFYSHLLSYYRLRRVHPLGDKGRSRETAWDACGSRKLWGWRSCHSPGFPLTCPFTERLKRQEHPAVVFAVRALKHGRLFSRWIQDSISLRMNRWRSLKGELLGSIRECPMV